ncbi:MAG: LamG-like jellyroll fold domain-containing protein [Polyangiales bacterium]
MRCLSWLLLLAACTPSSNLDLAVDLLSDLQPGLEVDRFELRMNDVSVFDGLPSGSLSEGARAVDLEVEAGDHIIAGRAFFNGAMVAERRVLVQVREDQALTVVLTRNCRDVECDEAGTTCANAMCVDPQCSPETPQFCASSQCEVATDCDPAGECGRVECRLGACLVIDDGRCGPGLYCAGDDDCVVIPSDAGVADSGVLDAGVTDAGNDAGITDAGNDSGPADGGASDIPVLTDTGPDVTTPACEGFWGELPVGSVAVVGADIGGTSNLSVTPASALLAPTLSIDLWVRFIEPLDEMGIMGSAFGTEGGFTVLISRTKEGDGLLTYLIEETPFSFEATGLLDGCWHHIALVRDLPAGRLSYAQDGNMQTLSVAPRSAPLMAGESGLFVGRTTQGDDPRAHIALHHLRFWNTALSENELRVLRAVQAGTLDPRLIDSIPMQMTTPRDGVQFLDSRGTLEAFLGWYSTPVGNAAGVMMTLGELDTYAAGF